MSEFIQCQNCQMYRHSEHPIQHCYGCEREDYDKSFTALRQLSARAHLLGIDEYRDAFFIYVQGQVCAVDGMLLRRVTYQSSDKLLRRITDLEAENKDVLAENARFRRRLEGKPSPSGSGEP